MVLTLTPRSLLTAPQSPQRNPLRAQLRRVDRGGIGAVRSTQLGTSRPLPLVPIPERPFVFGRLPDLGRWLIFLKRLKILRQICSRTSDYSIFLGSSMVKMQPVPGTSRAARVPRFASTARREISSPSPRPDRSLEFCLNAEKRSEAGAERPPH